MQSLEHRIRRVITETVHLTEAKKGNYNVSVNYTKGYNPNATHEVKHYTIDKPKVADTYLGAASQRAIREHPMHKDMIDRGYRIADNGIHASSDKKLARDSAMEQHNHNTSLTSLMQKKYPGSVYEETEEKIIEEEKSRAYTIGHQAFSTGQGPWFNTYDKRSKDHKDWKQGYEDSKNSLISASSKWRNNELKGKKKSVKEETSDQDREKEENVGRPKDKASDKDKKKDIEGKQASIQSKIVDESKKDGYHFTPKFKNKPLAAMPMKKVVKSLTKEELQAKTEKQLDTVKKIIKGKKGDEIILNPDLEKVPSDASTVTS